MTDLDTPPHRKSHTRGKLAVVGMAVGVGLFVAAIAINESIRLALLYDATASAGSAELTVLGDETGFPESKVEEVRRVPGVRAAVPLVIARVRLAGRPVVLLGVDRLRESAVRDHRAIDHDDRVEPLDALAEENSLLVPARFARAHAFAPGRPVELMTSFGNHRFFVRALLADSGIERAHGGNAAIMDIDAARDILGRQGLVDRIDVVPAAGERPDVLARRITAAIGDGYRVEGTAEDATRRLEMVAEYQAIHMLVAALALLIGMCLVAHAVVLSAAERRRELAIRRALGLERRRLFAQLSGEAALIGVMGGFFAVPVAFLLGEALLTQISESMTFQYQTPIDVAMLRFSAGNAITAVALGAVAATVAGLVPAARASQVNAQTNIAAEPTSRELWFVRLGPAAGGLALTALLLPLPSLLEALLVVAGTALLAPWLVAQLIRAFTACARRGPLSRIIVLRLATESLSRDPRRAATPTLALVAGLMFVVIGAATESSIATSIDEWEARTLASDVIVSGPGRIGALQVQPLHERVATEIDAIPGVDVADGRGARAYRFVRLVHQGVPIALKAMDPQHPKVGSAVFDVIDRAPDAAMRDLFALDQRTVLVSENFVRRFGQRTGDPLAIETPSGTARFRIVGVMIDFANPNGVIYLNRATYRALWHDPLVTAFMVEAAPGVTRSALRAEIGATLGPRGVTPITVDELRRQTRKTIEEAFAALRAIQAAAFLVGLLGLSGALLVTLMDRTRELASLRRRGVARGHVLGLVVAEATLLGAAGGGVAAALGSYVCHAWAVRRILWALGWRIEVVVPLDVVPLCIATGLLVGLASGLVCAQRIVARL